MERTADLTTFADEVRTESQEGDAVIERACPSSSAFVLRASELLTQMTSFESLLSSTADSFVDYHRLHPLRLNLQGEVNMNDAERKEFSQEIAIFISAFAAEVRDLKKTIVTNSKAPSTNGKAPISDASKEEISHKEDISTYLLERLREFTKVTQRLHNERMKYSVNPLCLFNSPANTTLKQEFKNPSVMTRNTINDENDIKDKSEKKYISDLLNKLDEDEIEKARKEEKDLLPSRSKKNVLPPINQSFVDRYESEIAPPKQLKEYHELGLKHKKILLKESQTLRVQYSSDLLEASKMEKTVQHVSNMLIDFVNILQGQRDNVDDVNSCGKATLEFVKDTDGELALTIQRSESHSKSMMFLTVGLAFLLLLLDYITP